MFSSAANTLLQACGWTCSNIRLQLPSTNEALTAQTSSRHGCKATQLQQCANAAEGREAAVETLTVTLATVTGWAVGNSYPSGSSCAATARPSRGCVELQ